jgi:hypothetical protein
VQAEVAPLLKELHGISEVPPLALDDLLVIYKASGPDYLSALADVLASKVPRALTGAVEVKVASATTSSWWGYGLIGGGVFWVGLLAVKLWRGG